MILQWTKTIDLAGWSPPERVHVAGGLPGRAEGPRHGRRLRLEVHEGRRHQRRTGNEQDGQDAQAAQQVDGQSQCGVRISNLSNSEGASRAGLIPNN